MLICTVLPPGHRIFEVSAGVLLLVPLLLSAVFRRPERSQKIYKRLRTEPNLSANTIYMYIVKIRICTTAPVCCMVVHAEVILFFIFHYTQFFFQINYYYYFLNYYASNFLCYIQHGCTLALFGYRLCIVWGWCLSFRYLIHKALSHTDR